MAKRRQGSIPVFWWSCNRLIKNKKNGPAGPFSCACNRISPEQLRRPEPRRDDADTSAAWERDRPLVFGGLLDLFADALRILPTVTLSRKQRMADFERLGEAVARALGFEPGEFQRQYAELVRAGIDRALESNAVAQVLDKYFEERVSPWNWQGTAGQLQYWMVEGCVENIGR